MKSLRLVYLALSILAISFSSCSEESTMIPDTPMDDSSPNIVLIIADDMGWDAFGDYPEMDGLKANTPTLDSLAMNGVSFLNFWTNPICAPTRAAMLTGKYAFRNGVGGVQTPQQATLASNETIIQKYINENTDEEYASAVIGKWHVSSSSQLNAPEDFGIDYYSGIFLGAVPDYYNWTQTSSGQEENITTYVTTHLVNQSISWIEQQSKPFFLWLAFNAPHTPFHRPPLDLISDQSLADNQAAINAEPLPYYLASIEAMDKEISRLIGSMTTEQRENTVFIVLGDNGTPRDVSQSPYLGNRVKGTLFKGGINTPLIISGKDISRNNVQESALVHAPDIFTTIADLAGTGDTEYQDGISVKSLLTGTNVSSRNYIYSEQFESTNTVNDGYCIRNGDYKLIHLEDGTEYLYDLSSDRFETDNLLANALTEEAQQNLDEIREIKVGL